jgi:hypothetical protein
MKSALLGVSLLLLGVASSSALANTQSIGTIGVPSSFGYNNTISNTNPVSVILPDTSTVVGTSFYDDYTFTVAPATATSVTTSINLGTFLNISGLQARLFYTIPGPQQTGPVVPGTLIQAWGTSITAGAYNVTNVVLQPIALSSGNYTLQIRGVATGSAGGSYAGVFNVAAVPETDTYAMLIAGLGVVNLVARRKSNKA